MQIVTKEFMDAFRAEAKRQEGFTNSFSRQLAVILVSIVLIQYIAPKILLYGTNISASWSPF